VSGAMTVAEAAEYLKLHPNTIRAMWRDGVLRGGQYKRAIRLDRESVLAFHRGDAARTGTDP
jgi:excisionase family DNA binding protein